MTANRDENCFSQGSTNHFASTEKSNRHDSIEGESDDAATSELDSRGLPKKARCSSLGSQSLKGDVEQVDREGSRGNSELPNPLTDDVDPDTYLIHLVQAQSGKTLKVKAALDLLDYFPAISDAQVAAYNTQIVSACRNNEVETLKSLWKEGHSLECCNRFGESLLHMACRRGFVEVVQFLLEEVGLAVRIRDDCGRTPFHDACWHAQPQQRICEMLLERDPELLLIADKRGHTPFQYAREHDWQLWRQMLFDHRNQLHGLASEDTLKYFS